MKYIIIILSLFILTTRCFCQNYEPLDLAKKIFGKEDFTNLNKFITGEYQGVPNGQYLDENVKKNFLLLSQSDSQAVIDLAITDSTHQGIDMYLFFNKDSVWKMSAFRALAMTGVLAKAVEGLKNLSSFQIDSIIKSNDKNKLFNSRKEFNFLLGNSELVLSLDDSIIQHFINNKAEFNRIKDIALQELKTKKSDNERAIPLIENLKSEYQKLFISSISFGDYELGGKCLNFSIGGILDNTVGYLYVEDKKDLPEMSPDRIIMIREMGDGWYIYKTT